MGLPSKAWVLGLGVIGLGAVVAYRRNDTLGVLLASACLIVGLVVIVASEARGLVSRPSGTRANSAGQKQAQLIVLVKGEVHAYPERNGTLAEMKDANQTDLEFNVFLNCWLVLGSELSLKVADLQLMLKKADGSTRVGKRVTGDLNSWHLAHAERVTAVGSDWKRANIQPDVTFTELDTATPLDCGVPRQGWVHFQIRDTTPVELKSGSLELSIKDSFSHEHTAVVNNVRQLPGKVSPIQKTSVSEVADKKDRSSAS